MAPVPAGRVETDVLSLAPTTIFVQGEALLISTAEGFWTLLVVIVPY